MASELIHIFFVLRQFLIEFSSLAVWNWSGPHRSIGCHGFLMGGIGGCECRGNWEHRHIPPGPVDISSLSAISEYRKWIFDLEF